jgi:superfamily II DNA or RNA helicase
VIFRWSPVYTRLLRPEPWQTRLMARVLTFKGSNLKWDKRYLAGEWDGYYRYFDEDECQFPSGLLDYVLSRLARHGAVPTVEGLPPTPEFRDVPADLFPNAPFADKYDFQRGVVARILVRRRGLVHCPPRTGKTNLAAAVIKLLDEDSLFLVNQGEYLNQTYARFTDLGLKDVGRVDDAHKDFEARHVVATIQSINSAIKRGDKRATAMLRRVRILQADEVHGLGSSPVWLNVCNLCAAPTRVGWSGTAFQVRRAEGSGQMKEFNYVDFSLVGVFGPPAVTIPSDFCRARGILNEADFYFVKVARPWIPSNIRSWPKIERRGIVENRERNEVVVRAVEKFLRDGRRVLVLVRQVSHGKFFTDRLGKRGIDAPFVFGGKRTVSYDRGRLVESETDADAGAIARFRRGETRCLVASTILDQGIDMPALDTLVVASGMKKRTRVTQRAYRALTRLDDKRRSLVLDFLDVTHPVLRAHSTARRSEYRAEGLHELERAPI